MAVDNLNVQIQLNKLLLEANKMLEQQSRIYQNQARVMLEIAKIQEKMVDSNASDNLDKLNEALEKGNEQSKNYGETIKEALKNTEDGADNATKKVGLLERAVNALSTRTFSLKAIGASALSGFVEGLRFTGSLLSNVASLGFNLVKVLGHIGVAILSIPFDLLRLFISDADASGGSNELAQALEEIRKEFGQLKETAGRAIIDIARSMKGELANTGLRVRRIFGNLAETLRAVAGYAKNMGVLFENIAPQILRNAEAFAAYTKGLHLTEEAQKAVAARAYATGTDITEIQRQMANYSVQLGEAFHLSAAMISRDMGDMMADFQHFGHLGPQVLAQTAVYARRLGIEVKALTGLMDRFANFEDAAQAAAQLSQAFGLNIDAVRMIKAQNPAEQMEQLRKAFFRTGRSVEQMTYQERRLLASQTGLDDASLGLVFSLKNQSLSYAEIARKGEMAKKKQLSQAEAMTKLAGAIERLVQSGGALGSGGFLNRFVQGFQAGIRTSREYRDLMRSLRRALRDVFMAGRDVGRVFVQAFPGVRDFFQGFREFFSGGHFRRMVRGFVEDFRVFFRELTTNPQTALPRLMQHLKERFFNYFDPTSAASRKVLGGLRAFFVAFSHILGSLVSEGIKGLAVGVETITDLISGRRSIGGGPGAAAAGTGGFIFELIKNMIRGIWPALQMLGDAFMHLFSVLWTKLQPVIERHGPRVLRYILAAIFGPAVISAGFRTIAGLAVSGLASGIGFLLKRVMASSGTRAAAASVGQTAISNIVGGMQNANTAAAVARPGAAAGAVADAGATSAAAQAAPVTPAAIPKLLLIAAVVMIGIAAVTLGIIALANNVKNITGTQLAVAVAAIAAATAVMGAITAMATVLGAVPIPMLLTGGVALIAIAAFAFGLSRLAPTLITPFLSWNLTQIKAAAIAVTVMGALFGTAILVALATMGLGWTGIVGATMMLAGMVQLGIIIRAMTTQAMDFARTIDQFHPSPGFREKAETLALLIRAIGSFARDMSGIISAASPSIVSLILGGNRRNQFSDNLRAAGEFITLISQRLQGLVGSLITAVNGLPGGEQFQKSGQLLASLISGVGELSRALTPTVQAAQQDSGFWARASRWAFGGQSGVQSMTTFVNAMAPQIEELVSSLSKTLSSFATTNFTDKQLKAAQLLVDIIPAVTNMAKALTPSADQLTALATLGAAGGNPQEIVDTLIRYMSGPINAIVSSGLIDRISSAASAFVQSTSSLNETQVNTLKAVVPLLEPLFTIFTGIFTSIGNVVSSTRTGADLNTATSSFESGLTIVSTFFIRMRTILPPLIGDLLTTIGSMPRNIIENLKNITPVFAVLQRVMEMPGQIQQATEQGEAATKGSLSGADMAQRVQGMIMRVAEFLKGINNIDVPTIPEINRNFTASITAMVAKINQISSLLSHIRPMNIQTGLDRLAHNLGLGRTSNFTIDHRSFSINVRVEVKIDAVDLERILLERPNSRIQPRSGSNNTQP